MSEFWRKLDAFLFHPPAIRWLVWLSVGPLFILAAATFALLAFSPFHAIVLLLSIFSHFVFWKVSPRFGMVAIIAVVGFGLFSLPSEMRWWNGCWLASLVSGLMISLYAISEAGAFFQSREKKTEEVAKEADLWQHRFATMKDKIEEDRKLWENEIDVVRSELEEKKSHVQSLKTLLEVIHRDAAHAAKRIQELKQIQEPEHFEIEGKIINKEEMERIINDLNFFRAEYQQANRILEEVRAKQENDRLEVNGKLVTKEEMERIINDLNFFRTEYQQANRLLEEAREKQGNDQFELDGKIVTKDEVEKIITDLNFFRAEYHQVNHLLEQTQEKLRSQEEAIQERQRRNQSLLGTNNKKSISLKDLAKKS